MHSKNKRRKTPAENAHVDAVRSLPCSVCDTTGRTEAHEINQGQWFTCVALCDDCHRGSQNGIHGQRVMWRVTKMDELAALNVTIKRLMGA